ncbi:hypothetical protein JD77_00062 [Micromonospora olivasterospora]|uniref:Alpha/beta hydrolase family protein n=1 Tax=Micromonospora olivasterospora TaxID=1880 RepID=A0A562I267_MICOL|nr:alpha/beta hydrolase [Micromonospora olivasterospora]TWH65127.1 hypothetical protein JD77_00062 [Micromonospora olivasterospora]
MKLRALGAIVVAAALASACAAPAAEPPAGDAQTWKPPSRLDWRPCAADATTRCATLRVPLDWSAPGGGTTAVEVTRSRATDPARRVGVLVYPPPTGVAGLSPALRERFDLVTYTERTLEVVDASASCVVPADVTTSPRDAAEFQHLVRRNREAFRECARRHGASWHHQDSATEARDVDAIRAALGERQISFLNTSATNLVGQAYAELFADRLRALVLDGSPDHSIASTGPYLASAATGIEATFQAFADWCERTPECGFHGMDLRGFYRSLAAQAQAGGFKDLRGFPFDFPGLASVLEFRLAEPHLGWFDMAERLREISARQVYGRTHADAAGAGATAAGGATVPAGGATVPAGGAGAAGALGSGAAAAPGGGAAADRATPGRAPRPAPTGTCGSTRTPSWSACGGRWRRRPRRSPCTGSGGRPCWAASAGRTGSPTRSTGWPSTGPCRPSSPTARSTRNSRWPGPSRSPGRSPAPAPCATPARAPAPTGPAPAPGP